MKKTLEYLYIFSKLSTSLILLISILLLGYFFYASFKNQAKTNNDKIELLNKLNNNAEKLSQMSKKIEKTDNSLNAIKKSTEKKIDINNSQKISLLNDKIEELNIKLESISISLQEFQTQKIYQSNKNQPNNKTNIILNKNKKELAQLIIFKFENNLNFTDELKILEKLNNQDKQHIFEKINLIKLKNFRGNTFIKATFSKELDVFLKEKYNKNFGNFISKSLMRFVSIEPSKKNIIKHNEISVLNDVTTHLDKKNYIISNQKLININNYEIYFKETIKQIKIFIEFEELIKKVT